MFTRWNPGYFIRETETYPHTRTLRTTFRQKLSDTFRVLSGFKPHELLKLKAWVGPLFNEHDAGLLDYATLFIPYLLGWPCRKIMGLNIPVLTGIVVVFFFPLVLLPVCVQILRFAAAAVLTVTAGLLISLAVHIFAQIWAPKLKQIVLDLTNQQQGQAANSFSQVLASQGLELEDNELELYLKQGENALDLDARKSSFILELRDGSLSQPFFSHTFGQDEDAALIAILELNVGKAGSRREHS